MSAKDDQIASLTDDLFRMTHDRDSQQRVAARVMSELAAATQRAERAEQRGARLREALLTLTCHDCGEMFTETVGALLANDAVAPLVPMLCADCGEEHHAALAGTPEAAPEFTPAEREAILSGSLTVPRSVVERAEQEQARAEPACTEMQHVVLPSGEACQCGKNRMERLL